MNRRAAQARRNAAGFTLVELLLATTLISILLALTYTGLRAATRSAETGEALLEAVGELRAAHQFVRRRLNQMLPLPFALEGDTRQTRVVFEGDANHVRYVAPMPGYLGAGGPQVQLLELAQDREGGVLQFRHALLQAFEEERLLDREPVFLLGGIEAAGFEFLGRDEEGRLTGWVSSWEQPEELPVAVRLKVEFPAGSRLEWPDLVAGVRVDSLAVRSEGGSTVYQQAIQDLIRGSRTGETK